MQNRLIHWIRNLIYNKKKCHSYCMTCKYYYLCKMIAVEGNTDKLLSFTDNIEKMVVELYNINNRIWQGK